MKRDPAAQARTTLRRRKRIVLEIIDVAVARGEWNWAMSKQGLRFIATAKKP